MDEQEKQLKQLRAKVPTIQVENETTLEEAFQNEVLRPILKAQNDRLIRVFRSYLRKRRIEVANLSLKERLTRIVSSLQRDQALRHLFIGMVSGWMTGKEWEQYQGMEKEVNRRIIGLIEKRLADQIDLLLE